MESKAKLFGHPIHQQLVVFPLGVLVMSLIFDIIGLVSGNGEWHRAAFYMIGAGVISGLVAAVFGAIDWWAIPFHTRAKSVGLWHGVGNIAMVTLFAISWLLRYGIPAPTPGVPPEPGAIPIILSFIAVGLGVVTGWLGGELVDRLGVGVDPGAHLDAPSSLSGRPVNENASGPQGPQTPLAGERPV